MTTSYKLSLKLKELGVEQNGGEYYWVEEFGKEVCIRKSQTQGSTINEILCRAFTLGELVRELPDGATIKKRMHDAYTAEVYWQNGDVIKDTPEEAAGELWAEIKSQELKQKEGI